MKGTQRSIRCWCHSGLRICQSILIAFRTIYRFPSTAYKVFHDRATVFILASFPPILHSLKLLRSKFRSHPSIIFSPSRCPQSLSPLFDPPANSVDPTLKIYLNLSTVHFCAFHSNLRHCHWLFLSVAIPS